MPRRYRVDPTDRDLRRIAEQGSSGDASPVIGKLANLGVMPRA